MRLLKILGKILNCYFELITTLFFVEMTEFFLIEIKNYRLTRLIMSHMGTINT